MSNRPVIGLSGNKNISQPQQHQTNPYFGSRINQITPGYSNMQYRDASNITNLTGQTNGKLFNNPPMGNTILSNRQQDMQYDYKLQGKGGQFNEQVRGVDQVKTQSKTGEFEWLTHTYAINYYAYNGNAAKIAEIVWTSLAAVKKIVIYTSQASYLKINDQIEKKINKNSVSKILIINQSHSSSQLKKKYTQFVLIQNKILITTKGSAASFQTGLIDVEDVQMIIFDGVCDAEDEYKLRVLRSYSLEPNKKGVAITVCGRDQNKLLHPIQSRQNIKFIQFKPNDLQLYLKQKPKTTNNFKQQPELTKKQQVYIKDHRKKDIFDSQSEFMRPSPTKSAPESVVDLSWITHFYFKPEYYMWKKIVSTLNQNKDNYNKAVVYVSTENFKKLKIYINEDLVNKSEVQYIDELAWETFGEAVNKFAASPYRILVITKTFSRMVTITPINADNFNFIIIDGILQAKDYKGIFTRTNLSKKEKTVSIIVLEYSKSRKEDLTPLERETGIKISQWSNQKLSDYLTIKRPQPEYQPQINRIELLRIEEQKLRRKKEQQQQLKRKEQQQRRRKAQQQQQRRRKAQQEQQRRIKAQQQQQRQRKEQQQQQRRIKAQQYQRQRKAQQQQQRQRKAQQQQKQQQQRRRIAGERLRGNERSSGIRQKGLVYETAGNNERDAKTVDKLQDSRKIILLEGDRQKTFRTDSRLNEQSNQQKSRINTKSEISEVSPIQKGMQPPVNTSSILTEFDAEAYQISPTRKKDTPLTTYQASKIQNKAIDQLTNGLNRIESIAKDGSKTQATILQKTMNLQSSQQQLIRDVNFLKQENKRNSARIIDEKKNEGAVYNKIYTNTEKIIAEIAATNNKRPYSSDQAVLNEISDSKKLLKQLNQRAQQKLDKIISSNENINKDQNELKTGIQRNFKQINQNTKLLQWLVQQQKANKKRVTTDELGMKIQELSQMQMKKMQQILQQIKQFGTQSRPSQNNKTMSLTAENDRLQRQRRQKQQQANGYKTQLQQQARQLQRVAQQMKQKQQQIAQLKRQNSTQLFSSRLKTGQSNQKYMKNQMSSQKKINSNFPDYYMFLSESQIFQSCKDDEKQFLYATIKSTMKSVYARNFTLKSKCLFESQERQDEQYWYHWREKCAEKPNLLVLMHVENDYKIFGFAETEISFIKKIERNEHKNGCLASITTKRVFEAKKSSSHPPLRRTDYHLEFGQQEVIVRSTLRISCLIGYRYSTFFTGQNKYEQFIGQRSEDNMYKLKRMEIHQIFPILP